MENYKILLVDDETDILDFLSYNLKKAGYTVFTANNGKDAVKDYIGTIKTGSVELTNLGATVAEGTLEKVITGNGRYRNMRRNPQAARFEQYCCGFLDGKERRLFSDCRF